MQIRMTFSMSEVGVASSCGPVAEVSVRVVEKRSNKRLVLDIDESYGRRHIFSRFGLPLWRSGYRPFGFGLVFLLLSFCGRWDFGLRFLAGVFGARPGLVDGCFSEETECLDDDLHRVVVLKGVIIFDVCRTESHTTERREEEDVSGS